MTSPWYRNFTFHTPNWRNFSSSNYACLLDGNVDGVESGGFKGGTAAVIVAVENPDDAAEENSGKGVGPGTCHAQFAGD